MDVSNVGKYLHKPVTLESMQELTLERNHMDASNVRSSSLMRVTFDIMNNLTLG
jgi:hypothetical protein